MWAKGEWRGLAWMAWPGAQPLGSSDYIASARFWTLLLFNLCLSSSPTAAEANKYKQLNGSSDEAIDGEGDMSGHDIRQEVDGELGGEVWATIPGFWLSQLTIDVFELGGGLSERSRAEDRPLWMAWCLMWSIIWSSSWFLLHLFVSLSGASERERTVLLTSNIELKMSASTVPRGAAGGWGTGRPTTCAVEAYGSAGSASTVRLDICLAFVRALTVISAVPETRFTLITWTTVEWLRALFAMQFTCY